MFDWKVTEDSFGEYLPKNWEAIAEALNEIIAQRIAEHPEERENNIANEVWEDYWKGDLPQVPEAIPEAD